MPGELRAPKVLFLGDSMSMGAFGETLDQELRDGGLEVYTSVTGGATPYYWLSDYAPVSSTIGHWIRTPRVNKRYSSYKQVPKVETLIKTYDPDIVIVQTGTNMYATLRSKRRTDEASEKEVAYVYERMCERVTRGGRRCFWITPPSAHEDRYPKELQERMRDVMKAAASPYGPVFDSYAITEYKEPFPQTDGIHYGPEEAKTWARAVARDFIAYAMEGQGIGRKALPIDSAEPGESKDAHENANPGPPLSMKPVSVKMRLVAKSTIEDLSKVTYKRALGISEYEVLEVDAGEYPFKTLRLAELIVEDRKIQKRVVDREIGSIRYLTLVPLAKYHSLERLETVDDLELNFDLPVMIPNLD